MLDFKINKNTFKSYIKKLKEKGIKEVKIFLVSQFNGMIDSEEEINETRIVPIEKIEEDIKYKDVYVYLDTDKKVIEVRAFASFHYHIIDENFEDFKKIVLTKFIAKSV
jgi:tagatose-1,6-bisphosphate aldolase